MQRPPASLVALLVSTTALGCHSSAPAASSPVAATVPSTPSAWSISDAELWTQRLFRMHYDGPEGDGSFKLTLRLASPDLFQMSAVDRLTRRWWGLSVADGEALFLDHRQKTFCRYGGEIEISAIPLGPLPFRTLPALLLGHLPFEAASAAVREQDELSFHDHRDRRWTARLEAEEIASWILWRDDEPEVWWQQRGSIAFLSARHEGLQLRWRQVVAERLAPPLAEMSIPADYVLGECS